MPRPRARARASTVSARVETFRSVNVRRPCQPSPAPRPNEMDARSATSSVTEARPPSTTPVPCDESDAPRSGRAVATSALRRPAASSAGRECASRAATPGDDRRGDARAAHRHEVREAVVVGSRCRRLHRDADATTSGLTWPPKACPQDENAAGTPRRVAPSSEPEPMASDVVAPSAACLRTMAGSAAGADSTGALIAGSRPSASGGQVVPGEHYDGCARLGCPHGRPPRRRTGGEQSRATGDTALALGAEEVAGVAYDRDFEGRAGVRRRGRQQLERPVEQHAQARPERHRDPRDARSQVGRPGRERVRRSARPADRPEAWPARPVVAGRDDDERVERDRAGDRAGQRVVRERRERLRQRDQRDARRIVRVAVPVRIDCALEAGDDLVGPAVDRPRPRGVALPAGDADRQDADVRRDPARAAGTAEAGDDAGRRGAVRLQPVSSGSAGRSAQPLRRRGRRSPSPPCRGDTASRDPPPCRAAPR